jgi:hypothetical protein
VFGGVEHFAEILLRTLAAGISCRFMGTSHGIGRNGNVPISSIPPGTEKAGGMNHATIDPSSMKMLPRGSAAIRLAKANPRSRSQKNKLEFRRPKSQGGAVFGLRREIVRVAHGRRTRNGRAIAVSTVLDNPTLKMLSLCVAGFGIIAGLPVFWALPTALLSGAAAAAEIAVIDLVGNFAGFAGPFAMGWIKDHTGNYSGGLLLLAALGINGNPA